VGVRVFVLVGISTDANGWRQGGKAVIITAGARRQACGGRLVCRPRCRVLDVVGIHWQRRSQWARRRPWPRRSAQPRLGLILVFRHREWMVGLEECTRRRCRSQAPQLMTHAQFVCPPCIERAPAAPGMSLAQQPAANEREWREQARQQHDDL
jgi:hypothetical protein